MLPYTHVLFLMADRLEKLLGPVGINVVTLIIGELDAASSVQFAFNR